MSRSNKISEAVLSAMNNFLTKEKQAGHIALQDDLSFITDGAWLKDAAVIDIISYRKGAWWLSLLFAYYKDPLKFIVRDITSCFSEQKAKAAAYYMRTDAAKDRRGTLTVSLNDLCICSN